MSERVALACESAGGIEYRLGVQGASLATLSAASFFQWSCRPWLRQKNQPSIEIIFVEVLSESLTNSENLSENFDCLLVEGSYRSIDQLGFLSRARRLLKPGGGVGFLR